MEVLQKEHPIWRSFAKSLKATEPLRGHGDGEKNMRWDENYISVLQYFLPPRNFVFAHKSSIVFPPTSY